MTDTKAEQRAAAAALATELSGSGTPWKDVLDAALDAMKERRFADANQLFDVLDVLHRESPPGWGSRVLSWHFDVPYRTHKNTVRIAIGWLWAEGKRTTNRHALHTFKPERRVKQILAAMLHLAHSVANHDRPRRYDRQRLAIAFGVTEPTMREWIRDGLRDLGVTDSEYRPRLVLDEPPDNVFLEEDFEPADLRQERRRERQLQRLHPT